MPRPVYGTANLFGVVTDDMSERLLENAFERGFRRFDTAPSYGHGQAEGAVGTMLGRHPERTVVTTKVGIAAASRPVAGVRLAKFFARRLPASVQDRVRGQSPLDGHGRFGLEETRASVEASLRKLGRIDRLLLHEVMPADISQELLTVLTAYVARGDVGVLGVATGPDATVACVAKAPELLEVVHLPVGPSSPRVALPASVATRVGHGVLGANGADLAAVRSRLASDPGSARAWDAAVQGSPFEGSGGLALALVARAAALDLDELILATSRPDRMTEFLTLLDTEPTLSDEAVRILVGDS